MREPDLRVGALNDLMLMSDAELVQTRAAFVALYADAPYAQEDRDEAAEWFDSFQHGFCGCLNGPCCHDHFVSRNRWFR